MKKNKLMRLASAILVLTLLTTSVISGTFAKYVTTDNASGSARVAKWGVTVAVNGTLFGTDYAATDAAANQDSIVAATSTSVSATEAVVAPGTKNDAGLTVGISGTPEVAYGITAEANGDVKDIFLAAGTYGVMVEVTGLNAASDVSDYYTLADGTYTKTAEGATWTAGTTYYQLIDTVTLTAPYYPIVWKIDGTETTQALSDTVTALLNAVKDTGDAGSPINVTKTLTWEWPYSVNDGADTILGDLQAGSAVVKLNGTTYSAPTADDYNLTINLGLTVTVTQAD